MVLPSQGSSLPSSSTICMSTPKTARPCLRRIASLLLGRQRRGACSSACTRCPAATSRSCPRRAALDAVVLAEGVDHRRRAGRAADHRALERARSCSLFGFMWSSSISQTVGTPAAKRHLLGSRSARRPTCRRAPGRGTPAWRRPSPREYGMPQALTWNIGTTGSTESRADRPCTSGKRRGVGVQDGRAVAVQRALGVAGGAARVAHARRRCSRRTRARRSRSARPPIQSS